MLHEAWQRHIMPLRQVTDTGGPIGELSYDRPTSAVGQRVKDAIQVSHAANYWRVLGLVKKNKPIS
jgi:hypothetical protein